MYCWTYHIANGPSIVRKRTVLIGSIIFVLGIDREESRRFVYVPVKVYAFDTVKMKWFYLRTPMNQDRTCIPFMPIMSPSVVAHDSKIYLWGAQLGSEMNDSLFCFDTKTLLWNKPQQYGAIPSTRIGQIACVVQDCMYISGGVTQNLRILLYDMVKLNLITMIWEIVFTMGPLPSIILHSVTAIGDKLYVYSDGFYGQNSNNVAMLYVLDTTSNQWTCPTFDGVSPTIKSLDHVTFSENEFLYVFNNSDDENGGIDFQQFYRYDSKNFTWTTKFLTGTPPNDKLGIVCTVVNDRVFVCGGIGSSAYDMNHSNDFYVLDLNPNLYKISLAHAKDYLKEKKIEVENLCIPLILKRDLGVIS